MPVNRSSILADTLYFVKNDLINNVTDPDSTKRPANSRFVMTSYPQRQSYYPLITIKATNIESRQAGMQSTLQDITLTLEIRIWARNEKEKDELYASVLNRLANIQFTSSTGSVANGLVNLNVPSAVEVDEDGEGDKIIKSRIISVTYNFYSS